MCGLLGGVVAADAPERQRFIFPLVIGQLLAFNDARGGDSFGASVIDVASGDVATFKGLGRAHLSPEKVKEIQEAIIERLEQRSGAVAVIGHTRNGTVGAYTLRNAHPFEFGERGSPGWIIGAHNGVVRQWEEWREHFKIEEAVEVDSEVIFQALRRAKSEEEVKLALGKLRSTASMALTWLQSFEELRLYREGNPLAVLDKPEQLLLWSSDSDHLKAATFGMMLDTKVETFDYNSLSRYSLGSLRFTETVKGPDGVLTLPRKEIAAVGGGGNYFRGYAAETSYGRNYERTFRGEESIPSTSGGGIRLEGVHVTHRTPCVWCKKSHQTWKMIHQDREALCVECHVYLYYDPPKLTACSLERGS